MSDNGKDYIALQPIDHLGVRAYNPGDRVPADNVQRHGYEKGVQVAEEGSKDALAITSPAASGEQDEALARTQKAATDGTPPASPAQESGTTRGARKS